MAPQYTDGLLFKNFPGMARRRSMARFPRAAMCASSHPLILTSIRRALLAAFFLLPLFAAIFFLLQFDAGDGLKNAAEACRTVGVFRGNFRGHHGHKGQAGKAGIQYHESGIPGILIFQEWKATKRNTW